MDHVGHAVGVGGGGDSGGGVGGGGWSWAGGHERVVVDHGVGVGGRGDGLVAACDWDEGGLEREERFED